VHEKFPVIGVVSCVIVYTQCQVYTMAAIVVVCEKVFCFVGSVLMNGSIHGLK
jgi:hypothetical protein